jgi:hypothetical protein
VEEADKWDDVYKMYSTNTFGKVYEKRKRNTKHSITFTVITDISTSRNNFLLIPVLYTEKFST